MDDYNQKGAEPWAVKAAGELANFLYNLDPNYEINLPENNFLKKFNFTDEKGRLVNKEGHLIAVDEDGKERLIDEEGYYVAYDAEGKQYFVNRDGEKIEREKDIVTAAFLDDDGNPIVDEEPKKEEENKANPAE